MRRGQCKRVAIMAHLAAAYTVGLAAFAVVNKAEAAKGGLSRPPTTGKAKPNPSPVVRDHRGEPKVLPAPPRGYYCRGHACSPPWNRLPKARVRDHRGPRVGVKEDPAQKW